MPKFQEAVLQRVDYLGAQTSSSWDEDELRDMKLAAGRAMQKARNRGEPVKVSDIQSVCESMTVSRNRVAVDRRGVRRRGGSW